jgi:hypothetical protein
MAAKRRTMRELSEEKNRIRREDMQCAIDEGRLTIRQMTPQERVESDAHQAAGSAEREARLKRSKKRKVTVG